MWQNMEEKVARHKWERSRVVRTLHRRLSIPSSRVIHYWMQIIEEEVTMATYALVDSSTVYLSTVYTPLLSILLKIIRKKLSMTAIQFVILCQICRKCWLWAWFWFIFQQIYQCGQRTRNENSEKVKQIEEVEQREREGIEKSKRERNCFKWGTIGLIFHVLFFLKKRLCR